MISWCVEDSTSKMASSYREADPKRDQLRHEFLEELYRLSGRDKLPNGHPLHGTYTGLFAGFANSLGHAVGLALSECKPGESCEADWRLEEHATPEILNSLSHRRP